MSFRTRVGRSLENSGWLTLLRRYAQFCIVGGSGVIVDMGIIYLLADPKALSWNLTVSKAIAAEIALINNFVWNELWTFRELAAARTGWRQRLARFLKFNLICAAWDRAECDFAERPGARPGLERVSGQFHRRRSGQRLEFPVEPAIWLEIPGRSTARKD